MAGNERGRSRSLLNIAEWCEAAGSDSAPWDWRGTGTSLTPARSMPSVTASIERTTGAAPAHAEVNPAQVEELLESGSPIGAEVMGDASLLDYESDTELSQRDPQMGPVTGKETTGDTPVSTDTDTMDMDIQHHLITNEGNMPSGSKALDAVYHQCRASRTSGFRETLISVSNDSTFGKKVISQSPPIGSFEDHAGIEKTFHGTRVLKGTVKVNQAVSTI